MEQNKTKRSKEKTVKGKCSSHPGHPGPSPGQRPLPISCVSDRKEPTNGRGRSLAGPPTARLCSADGTYFHCSLSLAMSPAGWAGPEPWGWACWYVVYPLTLSPGLEALEDCFSRGGEEREEDGGGGLPMPRPPGPQNGPRVTAVGWGRSVSGFSPALRPPGEPLAHYDCLWLALPCEGPQVQPSSTQ